MMMSSEVWVLDATPGKVRAGGDKEDHPFELISFLRTLPKQWWWLVGDVGDELRVGSLVWLPYGLFFTGITPDVNLLLGVVAGPRYPWPKTLLKHRQGPYLQGPGWELVSMRLAVEEILKKMDGGVLHGMQASPCLADIVEHQKCDAIMKHCTSCGRATGRQPWGPATCCSQISTSRGPVLMDQRCACTYDCDRPSIEELRLLVVKALFIGEGEGDSTDGNKKEKVASKRDVVVALERHGFSKDVAQWVVTNLRESSPSDSSPSSFSWVFDLNGIAEMYQSYEETSLWKIVEDVPRGVHVNFLKAERSLHRWALEDLQRIHVAEELAADEGGGVEMHVLEDAGHWDKLGKLRNMSEE
ncbi:hypothetical protein C3L33_15762, partial [Rhododendron williamsianum]